MGAIKELLAVTLDRIEQLGSLMPLPDHGYICKKCGQASPVGVGYVADGAAAAAVSAAITVCPCGNSRTATPGPASLSDSELWAIAYSHAPHLFAGAELEALLDACDPQDLEYYDDLLAQIRAAFHQGRKR